MQSSSLGSTHGRTMSGVACHHRCQTSSHSQTASGMAFHHHPWMANTVRQRRVWHAIIAFGLADTVGRRRAWHAIITFGQHRRLNDIVRGMPSSPLDYLTQSDGVVRRMPSSPFDGKHSPTTSGVACHHRLRTVHTGERRRAWHAIIAFWAAQSVERCRASHDITSLGLHAQSDDVGCGMTSTPLNSTHDRQRRAWHDIIALGQHTWSATSG